MGLMFLLSPEDQRRLIQRIADILVPGGRLLFTSPAEIGFGNSDVMTGLESRSLGADEYRQRLSAVGPSVAREYEDEDEGQNHYFDVFKELKIIRPKSEMSE
jgi:SAM-dependent methyltransferase